MATAAPPRYHTNFFVAFASPRGVIGRPGRIPFLCLPPCGQPADPCERFPPGRSSLCRWQLPSAITPKPSESFSYPLNPVSSASRSIHHHLFSRIKSVYSLARRSLAS